MIFFTVSFSRFAPPLDLMLLSLFGVTFSAKLLRIARHFSFCGRAIHALGRRKQHEIAMARHDFVHTTQARTCAMNNFWTKKSAGRLG